MNRREFLCRFRKRKRNTPPADAEPTAGRLPLSDLGELPDETVLNITPVLRDEWRVELCGDLVCYKGASGERGELCLSEDGCACVRLFDGNRTLLETARILHSEYGVPLDAACRAARETFLKLSMAQVYHPSNPDIPGIRHTGDIVEK